MSDLIKLVLTSSDAHLSHNTVLGGIAQISRQNRNSGMSLHHECVKKMFDVVFLLVVKQWRQA